jgi:GNAT superfamily N-acetyltransferase
LYTGRCPEHDDTRLLDPATDAARVRAMFVRSDWTRRGLGKAILAASEHAAYECGFSDLILMATLPGVPLYHAYGFKEAERAMVLLPDGVPIAGALMTRKIRPSSA